MHGIPSRFERTPVLLSALRDGLVGSLFIKRTGDAVDGVIVRDYMAWLNNAATEGCAGLAPFVASDDEGGNMLNHKLLTSPWPNLMSLGAAADDGLYREYAEAYGAGTTPSSYYSFLLLLLLTTPAAPTLLLLQS